MWNFLNRLCFWKKEVEEFKFPQVRFGLFKNEQDEDCVGVKFDWPVETSDMRIRELFSPFIFALQEGRFHKTIMSNLVNKLKSENRGTVCNDIIGDIKELKGGNDIFVNKQVAVYPSEVFNGRNPMLHGDEIQEAK